jgi:acetolactate synthase I/II/III large subunit
VQLGGIDWEKLAQSFGADGVTVVTEQTLANALPTALKSKRGHAAAAADRAG